jgi:hypothetical protein
MSHLAACKQQVLWGVLRTQCTSGSALTAGGNTCLVGASSAPGVVAGEQEVLLSSRAWA